MVVFGTTTIFFSPSLYFSVISSPSTPLTIVATVALVMVLFGIRSQGRWPSPVPRSASGKMWISTAFWLPSACGMPVTPMNEFCLISDSEALMMPRTATLSAIFTLYGLAVPRLDRQHRSIDPFDGAAYPHRGRLLLGKGRGCGKQQGK